MSFFFQQIVRDSLSLDCKCHGLTASCSIHTCTRLLPIDFGLIAKKLFELYKKATQVELLDSGESRKELVIKKRSQGEVKRILNSDDMAYLIKSRDFCIPKNKLPGTKGRECGRKFFGDVVKSSFVDTSPINVCDYLCCGRGYHIKIENTIIQKCKCKFYMEIMDVKCKICKVKKELHTCR